MSDQEITGVNVTGVPLVTPEGELLNDPVEELLLDMQRDFQRPGGSDAATVETGSRPEHEG